MLNRGEWMGIALFRTDVSRNYSGPLRLGEGNKAAI
jgi:hypothetical protein